MSFVAVSWLLWMWLTVGLYWLAPRAARPFVLIGLSALFLASVSPESAAILAAFCLLTHGATNLAAPRLVFVAVAGAAMVGVLVGYKLTTSLKVETLVESLVIPMGLSYYTFRCLHFMIERYKGRVGRTSLRELAAYLFFLPTFLIGPIHRYEPFASDTRRQRFDPALMRMGLERIVQGYAQIVLLSNYATETLLGGYVEGLPDQDGAWAIYLGIVRDGLNLYFQFSGHSDIAIGFAMLLGYRVMENFHWPYLKPNISEFWKSWHRSLSSWCRDYIYGVVVATTRSPALGAMATMVAIGLWHEISFRFVLWGAWHGLGIIVWQRWRDFRVARNLVAPAALRVPLHVASVVLTVNFVWFGFVILTAPSIGEALSRFARFAGGF